MSNERTALTLTDAVDILGDALTELEDGYTRAAAELARNAYAVMNEHGFAHAIREQIAFRAADAAARANPHASVDDRADLLREHIETGLSLALSLVALVGPTAAAEPVALPPRPAELVDPIPTPEGELARAAAAGITFGAHVHNGAGHSYLVVSDPYVVPGAGRQPRGVVDVLDWEGDRTARTIGTELLRAV